MPVKITYFDSKGAAELIRYILAFAGHEFEDERIKRENWPAVKGKANLGIVPYMTMENGKQYGESVAIARYFAAKYGLTGKTEEEKLLADMVVDVIRSDIVLVLVNIFVATEAEKEARKMEAQTKIDALLQGLEENYVEGADTFLREYSCFI